MLQPSELIPWLRDTYSLIGEITIQLFRSYTNDVYLVQADEKYILKIYAVNWRSESEINYELALLAHLSKRRLHVATAIVGADGAALHTILTSKGVQFAVLFIYAAGHKPQPPYSDALYFAFGRAIARMHSLSDDFATHFARRPLDLARLIDSPLQLALPLIERDENKQFLQEVAHTIIKKITELQPRGLDWGSIHGDATLDNLHVTDDNQIVLYDFDLGGPGWRAADLQGWAKNNTEYAEKWVAFKQGYATARELKAIDLDAAPYLAVAWLIWGMQIDLEQRVLQSGREGITTYLQTQLTAILRQAELAFR